MHVIAGLLARSIVYCNHGLLSGLLSCHRPELCTLTLSCINSSSSTGRPRLFASDSFTKGPEAAKTGPADPSITSISSDRAAAGPVQHAAGLGPGSSITLSAAASSAPPSSDEVSASSSASILQKYISQELVTDVSSTINRLTGYEGIDRLKARVATVDEALTDCKKQLQAAKLAYDQQLGHQTQLHR